MSEAKQVIQDVAVIPDRLPTIETEELISKQSVAPIVMLQTALERGLSNEILAGFMDLHERYEKNIARKAYMEAIAAFKKNPPKVVKDKLNKQYGSNYSSLGNMVNTVNEALGAHNLNASWDFDQSGETIKVTCILSHAMGHSEKVSMSAPPDTSGSKNPIQQIKSTMTYLKLATFEAVTGIASVDGNLDDDGNVSGQQNLKPAEQPLTPAMIKNLRDAMTVAGVSDEKMCEKAGVSKIEEIQQGNMQRCKTWLQKVAQGSQNA